MGGARGRDTDHPHEVLLTVFLFAEVATVIVAICGVGPTPETAALLLFFANGTFAGCVHGVVIAKRGACDVEV